MPHPTVPTVTALPLGRWREPFDDRDWLFELKYDGFRALAFVEGGACRLVSRTGYTYKGFGSLCTAIAATIPGRSAVLDGELVCLAADGRPDFYALLYRRADPFFYAFDLVWLDGVDLRDHALVERKRLLRRIIPRRLGRLRYVEHVAGRGVALFQLACEHDLEGIVAKWKQASYRLAGERSPWLKIKNPGYSQTRDRHELFERRTAFR